MRVWGRGCARPAFHMHLRCPTFGNVHKFVRCLRFRPTPDLRGRPQFYPCSSPTPRLAAPPQLQIRDTILTLPTLPGPGQTPGPLFFYRRVKVVSLSASGLELPRHSSLCAEATWVRPASRCSLVGNSPTLGVCRPAMSVGASNFIQCNAPSCGDHA